MESRREEYDDPPLVLDDENDLNSSSINDPGPSTNTTPKVVLNQRRRCVAAVWQAVLLLLFLQKELQVLAREDFVQSGNDVTTARTTATATSSSTDAPVNDHSENPILNVGSDMPNGSQDEFDNENDDDDLVVYTEDSHDSRLRNTNANFENPNNAQAVQSNRGNNRNGDDGIIVVSTVDGTLAGLSRLTGHTLWKRPPNVAKPLQTTTTTTNGMGDAATASTKEGSSMNQSNDSVVWKPLVSTTTTAASSNQKWRTAAVPSLLDGKVYLTSASTIGICEPPEQHGSSSSDKDGVPPLDGSDNNNADNCSEAQEETVTAHIRDLVDRAPFVDQRGRLYTAHSQSVAVAVNLQTGATVNTLTSPHHASQADLLKETTGSQHTNNGGSISNLLWMGRVDHTISIHEPLTGAMDVQFTTAELMSVNDMLLTSRGVGEKGRTSTAPGTGMASSNGDDDDVQRLLASQSDVLVSSTSTATTRRHNMIATPSGSLAFLDEAGDIAWVAHETFDTPVAFALDSTTGFSLTIEYVPDAVAPNGSSDHIVKEMKRQLELGLVDATSTALTRAHQDSTIFGSLPQSGQLFALPLGQRQPSETSVASESSASHHPTSNVASSSALTAREQNTAGSGRIMHQYSDDNQHYQWQHHGDSRPRPMSCSPGNPFYPKCLPGSHDRRRSHPHFIPEAARGSPFEVGADGAIVPFYHPEYGYRYIPPDQFYMLQHEVYNSRKRYQKALMVFGSWLPALIVVIFVSSFELGRRKKQKNEVDAKLADAKANAATAKGQVDHGIIQVDENVVLGHGGHGTVVYRGSLEGRQVAVKRMLKTYNASADREIALLIESDGHPNVVRYFLKEARGDFVYLALELCDLSLHDLIGHIRQRLDLAISDSEKRIIFEASKSILYQIAKGAEHLHKLRIVHRDLKPANILLGDARQHKSNQSSASTEAIYDVFEKGGYVAKISDMGLGKQLVGQSSYGEGSLQSSLRGQTSRGQSSIIGVGPGSVGWQAPEVMALRMPSDISVKSDGSFGLSTSSEMSPIDVSPNARTSRAVDIFSLGCIFYSMLVPGSHPFGEWYEREANVMNNRPNIELVKSLSMEAHDLINAMLKRSPTARPTAKQICEHPLFWAPDRRLAFLCDFSDRLETDGSSADSVTFVTKLLVVERDASNVVGTSWDVDLHPDLVSNVQRFRSYDPSSVRDLLRLIRNKHHHFDELPQPLRDVIGSKGTGLMQYFEERFPRLFIHCFHACRELYSSDDDLSVKYAIFSFGRATTTPTPAPQSSMVDSAKTEQMDVARETKVDAANSKMQATNGDTPDLIPEDDLSLQRGLSTVLEEEAHPSSRSDTSNQTDPAKLIVWYGSTAAQALNCRGWNRSDDEWQRRGDCSVGTPRRDANLVRCAEDPKFRTRLCNHWDESLGTACPMRKKNKCIFAHGPVELRVKEAKRNRWGKLVDVNGDNNNPNHSGGEDTYGAARAIESERKQEGKWNTDKAPGNKGKKAPPAKRKQAPVLVAATG